MHRVKSMKGWRKPESGSAEALQEQGWRMIKGDMFAKRMAPGRREEASRVLEQAAERGNARAMCNLAALLASDERERAFHWAERAVETGQAAALVQMALLMNAKGSRQV
jgi:TPR repeat protein